MFEKDQYELIEFGNGTKVERFGNKVIARESPSVERFRPRTAIEQIEVASVYRGQGGRKPEWIGTDDADWNVRHRDVTFSLRYTPTGQVGLFPEQAKNWDWISSHAEKVAGKRAINLFAYTGGSTLALASCGANVTHVDSASSVVAWARKNASLSGLEKKPVRWIVEDALKFLRREIKRGNTYDIFVADPPSFGRGTKNETWKIERDLSTLLEYAGELCPEPTMAIVSCHTPSIQRQTIASMVRDSFGRSGQIKSFELDLVAADGRRLPSGDCVRWIAEV